MSNADKGAVGLIPALELASLTGYQLICLISQPLLIALRHDWYRLKGLSKGFELALRPWESSKNWWRYDQMKFVTDCIILCPRNDKVLSQMVTYYL